MNKKVFAIVGMVGSGLVILLGLLAMGGSLGGNGDFPVAHPICMTVVMPVLVEISIPMSTTMPPRLLMQQQLLPEMFVNSAS